MIIITDFLQGIFTNIVCLIIVFVIFATISWNDIFSALEMAPKDASLIHPFHSQQVKDFNAWYYIVMAFTTIYGYMAWQGSQGFNASAKNAHEARMSKIVGFYRGFAIAAFIMVLPVVAYTLMHLPKFHDISNSANMLIGTIDNETIQKQMTVPILLSVYLPKGIAGLFCAIMFAAALCTHDTYMHSWGSIFIQDVVMPFKKTALSSKQHIWFLRFSILGVAVFAFFFSLLYYQTEYIFMFFAVTGSIFIGGAGSVIIGGLYWKRGTTAAAWAALITGAVVSVGQVVATQICKRRGIEFPLNGMWQSLITSIMSILVYVVISLAQRKSFNMDKLLHRGEYKIEDNQELATDIPVRGWRALIGVTQEFTVSDKILYFGTVVWTVVWTAIFVVGTVYNMMFEVGDKNWELWWKYITIFNIFMGICTTIWVGIGGFKNMVEMYSILRKEKVDIKDDGRVESVAKEGQK